MRAAVLTGADLAFEAETHTYRRPDGVIVPSVTQILRAVGISADFEHLKSLSGRLGDRIDYRRDLGTAVHADCHAFDDDDIVWGNVHPDVAPFVEAWAAFLENTGLVPSTRERRLFHAGLGVCGTLDGIFSRFPAPEHRILIDIKIGDPRDAGADVQTAAYQLLWDEEHPGEPIAERWSVQLTPELGVPYRIHPYTDWTDAAAFRACVCVYQRQAARRTAR
jgi:hypothetical protein